jgi:hypothetical protein
MIHPPPILPLLVLMLAACGGGPASRPVSETGSAGAERWWSHVTYLADDRLEGRDTGSAGHKDAARYVAREYERLGVEPAGTEAYFQTVPFVTRRIIEEQSSLALVRNGNEEPLELGKDAMFSTRTDLAPEVEGEAVFAGYGLSIPDENHDDLAGLDLRGKIVVYLSGHPNHIRGPVQAHFSSAAERQGALLKAGAIGAIAIPNPRSSDLPWDRSVKARLNTSMDLAGGRRRPGLRLSAAISPDYAPLLFKGTNHAFEELLGLAAEKKPLPRFPLPFSIRARTALERGEIASDNVIGVRRGSDPELDKQYVILTAHLDHVGVGAPVDGDNIYNGAMDNASGVATLLEVARMIRGRGASHRRSILFAAVTGEEKGLKGSQYLAVNPTVPAGSIVANINLDMYLPLHPLEILTAMGLEESSLASHLNEVAEKLNVRVEADPEPERNRFIRSDQYSFIKQGIPSLALKFGYEKGSPEEQLHKEWLKKRYHAPSDHLDQPVDKEAAAEFNRFVMALVLSIANDPERPRWNDDSFFRRFAR